MWKQRTTWLDIPKQAFGFLLLLLCIDLGFILLHVLHMDSGPNPSTLFSLEYDGGYAEYFQYLKFCLISVMLLLLFWRTRDILYASWMVVFTYLLLDDSLFIHEQLGEYVAKALNLPFFKGLRPLDLGELLVNGVAGSVVLVLLAVAYKRAAAEARIVGRTLMVLLLLTVFFGVVVDTFHSNYLYYPWAPAVGTIEDAGEMVCISLACWYVFTLAHSAFRSAIKELPDLVHKS